MNNPQHFFLEMRVPNKRISQWDENRALLNTSFHVNMNYGNEEKSRKHDFVRILKGSYDFHLTKIW